MEDNECRDGEKKVRPAIIELANMISVPMSLTAAIRLHVPDAIWQGRANTPLSASQILTRILPSGGGDAENLQRILRLLTSYGVFSEYREFGGKRRMNVMRMMIGNMLKKGLQKLYGCPFSSVMAKIKLSTLLLPLQDVDRPTSNPMPPQSEAFADYQNAQQALETVAQQVPNFGTEQDKVHCPFHLKTGACRFGQRCSRVYFFPDKSCTLLIKNMHNGPGLAWEQDEGLEVCRNGFSHLRGNVYVHYKSLESAVLAYHSVNGHYFAGKQITCEFINVTRWKIAICGEYMKSRLKTCSRGMARNFIHCFRNPGGDYEWADLDKPPPRYWVKKMAALFGYSNESGTWNQERSGQTRNKIDSTNADRHHYRRSRSREADRVKSGSGRSHDDKRQVHETTWSRRRSNYHSESRSDEANSDGSWSDRDRD
ncbi:hypothetical protein WN943_014508 [Citrus x changshan-huyou]